MINRPILYMARAKVPWTQFSDFPPASSRIGAAAQNEKNAFSQLIRQTSDSIFYQFRWLPLKERQMILLHHYDRSETNFYSNNSRNMIIRVPRWSWATWDGGCRLDHPKQRQAVFKCGQSDVEGLTTRNVVATRFMWSHKFLTGTKIRQKIDIKAPWLRVKYACKAAV